ncbi:hypothetical protein Tco_0064128, partial [Tanacetum coccineum]
TAGTKVNAAGLQLLEELLLLEHTKTAQAQEITNLKLRVKKLEKKARLRTHKFKRLYKGRSIEDIDKDAEVSLVDEIQRRSDDAEMFEEESYKDAKLLMKAIEKSSETMDQTFDRLQKLVTQLGIQGEVITQEDLNLKLLRSLPSKWKTHALIWRNKQEIETITLTAIATSRLMITDNTAYGVSAAHTQSNPTTRDNLSDAVIYNAASSTVASPAVESFLNSFEMLEIQEYNKPKSDKGYHALPPPFTGNFIPRKPDLTFMDEIVESKNMDVTTVVTPSNVKTVESNLESASVESNGDAIEPKTVRKNSFRPPVIEDWNSDDESEVEIIPKVKTVSPSTEKIKFVKSARETIEKVETSKQNKHYPRGNQRN